MKKLLKQGALGIFVLVFIYGIGRLVYVSYGSYQEVPRQPYLVLQTQNAVTIKWQSNKEELGRVAYGLTPQNMANVRFEQTSSKKHSLTLTNLKECTKYFYRVAASSLIIDNKGRSFTTLCEKKEKQRLWVIGDSGKSGHKQQEVYHQMLDYINHDFNKLDMWILLGDNAYSSGTQKKYNKKLFKPFVELVKRYVPWAVPGNHDMKRWAFYDVWDFPTNAESGGVASHREEFYSVEDGNLHLVMLDSETVSRSKTGKMAEWLKKDLSANTKPFVIVAFHTPPYTDGGHKSDSIFDSSGRLVEMRENFVPIFDKYGVDLVLSGHSHGYERSKLIVNHLGKSDTFSTQNIIKDSTTEYTKSTKKKENSGTIYQVCGSSSKLTHASYQHPALPISMAKMGSLIIEMTPTTLTSKFLTINGKIADEFTITKEK